MGSYFKDSMAFLELILVRSFTGILIAATIFRENVHDMLYMSRAAQTYNLLL